MDRPLNVASRAAAVLLAGVGGCVIPMVPAQPSAPSEQGSEVSQPAAPSGACAATAGQQVLERVNALRRERGLHPLVPELQLQVAAAAHTSDQADHGRMSHVGSDGSSPGERATRAGYRWQTVAENVGAGYASPEAAVAAWIESPGHRAIMLSPDPLHVGIGHVHRSGGRPSHFWTLMVAAPLERAVVRAAACHP